MDVDGTLTDGRIYIGSSGEEMKAFYVKDGYAISHILPKLGVVPAIITGRSSSIVSLRAQELGITEVYQGIQKKELLFNKLRLRYGADAGETAYIGDDLNDIECMRLAGIVGCPCDAVEEVKKNADFISSCQGGRGAVREFIEWLARNNA